MKRLVLNQTDKKITGLCAGIADYLDVDVTVVRLIVLTIVIMTGVLPGLFLYLIASAITPKAGTTGDHHA
jgi:phage shock protein C